MKRPCLLLCLTLGAASLAHAAKPALPPIAAFFENATFSGAAFSPNGKFLAVRTGAPGKRDGLAVIELATSGGNGVARFDDADIGRFHWVNDERLMFDTTDKQIGVGSASFGPGLFAVNRDGTGIQQLANRRGEHFMVRDESAASKKMLPWHTFMLSQRGAQDSEHVYVRSPEYDDDTGELKLVKLLRLNTLTGKSRVITPPAVPQDWLLDQKGEPRIVTSVTGDSESFYYREPENEQWRKLATFAIYKTSREASFTPLAFGPDGTLYVEARRGDKDAVYAFDFAKGAPAEKPLLAAADYDFDGELIVAGGKLLGSRMCTDACMTVWFDARMKAVQQKVDALLPGSINLLDVPARSETPYVLVETYSDVLPRVFLIYNTDTGKLNKVGDSHPAIQPAQMGHQEGVRLAARDGLPIPALLTLPPGGARKNLPMVVLVHGGPYLRGHSWGWNSDSQFLATRGYAVLEPEFRGSTGLGWKHFHSGWKQWGKAMQDDIADATKWAIAQGIADPRRICIAGASYGGYATLMGLVNDPDLFRCGVEWAGVTDIDLMFTGHWTFESDLSDHWKTYGMPVLVGDPVKDAAQFKATSPLAQAARITQPLLMAYGGSDRRVPLYHGRKFFDAVTASNAKVEWIMYPEEGHGWALPRNRIDFWGRVEKFLDRNIGPP